MDCVSQMGDVIRPRQRGIARAFSLLDILVSMAVIGLLITIMLPALAQMQETARRVKCGSNIRQIGMGIAIYSSDYQDGMPLSVFLRGENANPAKMTTLRLATDDEAAGRGQGRRGKPGQRRVLIAGDWDGLGVLIGLDYLTAPKLFYCPSHRGKDTYERFAGEFQVAPRTMTGPRVIGNYHYRGQGPNGQRHLSAITPSGASLVADGLESKTDFNHKKGTNLLQADMAVTWYLDRTGELLAALSSIESGTTEFGDADPWNIIDDDRDGLIQN